MEASSSGKIEIYESEISSNYAIQYLIGLVFETIEASVIGNTLIFQNLLIYRTDIPTELTSACTHLCFLSEQMKSYLAVTDLSSFTEAGELVRLIYGNLNIENNSHIYEQSSLFSTFLSTVEFRNSTISGISYSQSPIETISSLFIFEDMEVREITALTTSSFILATSSEVRLVGINYLNSNALLTTILYSDAILDNIRFTNIANSTEFIRVTNANSAGISQIALTNSSTTSEYLILIQKSQAVTISDITLTGLTQTFLHIENSVVSRMELLNISESKKVFSILGSSVGLLSTSTFTSNSDTGKGGVISMANSHLKIANSTFTSNNASVGGVISFECTSLFL